MVNVVGIWKVAKTRGGDVTRSCNVRGWVVVLVDVSGTIASKETQFHKKITRGDTKILEEVVSKHLYPL